MRRIRRNNAPITFERMVSEREITWSSMLLVESFLCIWWCPSVRRCEPEPSRLELELCFLIGGNANGDGGLLVGVEHADELLIASTIPATKPVRGRLPSIGAKPDNC